MRITAPGDLDLDVREGASAAEVMAAAGLERAWCGPVQLDPDHPAGVPPLVHGARLTPSPAPSALPPAIAYLHVVEGPDAGHVFPLGGPVVVGRSTNADLRVADPTVSAEHALVTGIARVRVRDLRSANGTAGSRRPLRAGDHLTLGRTRIALVDPTVTPVPDDAPRPTPPTSDAARRWGMLAAGLASGVGLAAMTGRWPLALVGLLPAAAPWLGQLISRRRTRCETPLPSPAGPLAVRGEEEATLGYIRAVLAERGRREPDDTWHEPWMRWLESPRPGDGIVRLSPTDPWPSWCAARVEVSTDGRVEEVDGQRRPLLPLMMSPPTADLAARRRASARLDDALPRTVRWGDLEAIKAARVVAPGRPRALIAAIGTTRDGPLLLDLDADGPHVLVAGTTGSGKSLALETLVTALAHAYPPSDLVLALVDFKGGAGLRGCLGLPHVAATLTDLDGALARRALAGLSHELAVRKAALREHGFSSVREWEAAGGAPPRLVVVIDEYQEIVASHPSFLPDLARLAAQGRSLGLHLVLATQRPAGAVTPEVRANVSTTVALRVASEAESRDLLGTADAAAIPAAAPGRAIVARGRQHHEVQIAIPTSQRSAAVKVAGAAEPAGEPLAHAAAARWPGHGVAAPLWLPPLPARWEPGQRPGPGAVWALVDRPATREQCAIHWDPLDGALLLIGPPRSGRTSALRAIAAHAAARGLRPVLLPQDPRLASRTLVLASERDDVLLAVDDVDGALTRLATVDDGAAVDDLLRRPALRLPTLMAGGTSTPLRLAPSASALAVLTGTDAAVASQWGVPRGLLDHPAAPAAGRAHVRHGGAWDVAQLAHDSQQILGSLVHPLPTVARTPIPDGMLGLGGDHADPVPVPDGPLAVVGSRSRTREVLLGRLEGREVLIADLPALVPPGMAAVMLTDPTPRALRALAPHAWRAVADPHPVAGRIAVIRDGVATAVQMPLQ